MGFGYPKEPNRGYLTTHRLKFKAPDLRCGAILLAERGTRVRFSVANRVRARPGLSIVREFIADPGDELVVGAVLRLLRVPRRHFRFMITK